MSRILPRPTDEPPHVCGARWVPARPDKWVLVDEEDYEFISKKHWTASKSKNTYYARATVYDKKRMLMHRLIMNNPETNIDHINGNGLDNRKSNLRLANESQNGANSRLRKNNKTGYKGVIFCETSNKFRADIMINYKRKHIGRYDTKEEAARAYDKKAKELFGEFAWLNFPEGGR